MKASLCSEYGMDKKGVLHLPLQLLMAAILVMAATAQDSMGNCPAANIRTNSICSACVVEGFVPSPDECCGDIDVYEACDFCLQDPVACEELADEASSEVEAEDMDDDKRGDKRLLFWKRAPQNFWKRSEGTVRRAKFFLGKRQKFFLGKRNMDENDEKRARAKFFLGKRAKFWLGKRADDEKRAKFWLGKRDDEFAFDAANEKRGRAKFFLGKKSEGSEMEKKGSKFFLGKKSASFDAADKRRAKFFLGKRDADHAPQPITDDEENMRMLKSKA